ncbi:MAG TPA: hypothetical protein VFW33_03400 [Gemmataceae bacterium]|nr:hypothetical protein [Gemmataceae bacterium]
MDPRLTVTRLRVLRQCRAALTAIPVCAALVPITIVGLCQWRAVREAESLGALKRDLLDRGLPVPDVERLAHGPPERSREEARRAEVEAALRVLRQSGMSPDEVSRALRPAAPMPPAPE